MIGVTVREAKAGFFDRQAVIAAVGRANVLALSKAGAYIRRSAKGLIRSGGKKGKVSLPGEPPRSHVGSLRDLIFFSWDARTRSVVVGPALFKQSPDAASPVSGTVPSVLEHGGQIIVKRLARKFGSRSPIVTIAPRPYMLPALNKNLDVLPPMWMGSVKTL